MGMYHLSNRLIKQEKFSEKYKFACVISPEFLDKKNSEKAMVTCSLLKLHCELRFDFEHFFKDSLYKH